MRVKLTTTVTTHIILGPGVTLEDAHKEILDRYRVALNGDNHEVEDLQATQANSVCYDRVVGSEVTHSLEEVK